MLEIFELDKPRSLATADAVLPQSHFFKIRYFCFQIYCLSFYNTAFITSTFLLATRGTKTIRN